MANETTTIYFSDGNREIIAAPIDQIASQFASTPEGFTAVTTTDGNVLHINRAHVVRLVSTGSQRISG